MPTTKQVFRMWVRIFVLLIGGLPALALAQDGGALGLTPQDTLQAHVLYKTAYEVALQDDRIAPDEQSILEALARVLTLSDATVKALRAAVDAQQPDRLDQEGRVLLIVQNVGWASGLYGWALPYALGADDEKWYIGTQMLSISAAFYLTYQWSKDRPVPHARAHMMRAGAGLGFRYGWGLNTLLDLENQGNIERDAAWPLMAAVPAGHVLGDYLYRRWKPSHGQAWMLTLWGEAGAYMVREVHRAADPEPRDIPIGASDPDEARALFQMWLAERHRWEKRHIGYELASYPLSIYIGHRMTRQKRYTFGDAVMMVQGRLLGAGYGALAADALGYEFDGKVNHAARAVGTLGGLLLFDRFIRDREYTLGQSVLSVLGTVSGASFAGGAAVILEIDEHAPLNTMLMAGGLVGFWISDRIMNVQREGSSASSGQGLRQLSILPSLHPMRFTTQGRRETRLVPSVQVNLAF